MAVRTLDYPALAVSPTGFTHAARPGEMTDGWAPALCHADRWVSVEHEGGGGTGVATFPVKALPSDRLPEFLPDHTVMVANGVDCRTCDRMLRPFFREV